MKFSSKLIPPEIRSEALKQRKLEHDFIVKHVPRLRRMLMEAFPSLKSWYAYSIARDELDSRKLTLLKGSFDKKNLRVIATNFDKDK